MYVDMFVEFPGMQGPKPQQPFQVTQRLHLGSGPEN